MQAGIFRTIVTKTYAIVWSAMHDNAFKLMKMIENDSDLCEKTAPIMLSFSSIGCSFLY